MEALLDQPLPEIGGKGVFTAELEAALLQREIHAAVHSLKDLPTDLGEEFTVLGVPEREDPRDVLLGPEGHMRPEDLGDPWWAPSRCGVGPSFWPAGRTAGCGTSGATWGPGSPR